MTFDLSPDDPERIESTPSRAPLPPRPWTVTAVVVGQLVLLGLGLIGFVSQLTMLGDVGADAGGALGVVALATLVGLGLGLLLLWFIWKGRSWARWVFVVLAGISVFNLLTQLGSPMTLISILINLAMLVLLVLPVSNEWFRAMGAARR